MKPDPQRDALNEALRTHERPAEEATGLDLVDRLERAIVASMAEPGFGYIDINRDDGVDIRFEAERIARFWTEPPSEKATEYETCPTCMQPVPIPQRGDHDYGMRLQATPPSEEATDPLSPQWEACKVCGGDHWTRDHGIGTRRYSTTPSSEEATGLREAVRLALHEAYDGRMDYWRERALQAEEQIRIRDATPPSEGATGLDARALARSLGKCPQVSPVSVWVDCIAAEYARLAASDGGRE